LPRRNTSKFGVISSAGSCSLERVLVMMKSKQQDSLFGSHNFDELQHCHGAAEITLFFTGHNLAPACTLRSVLLSAGRAISSPPRSLVNSGIAYPTRCSKPLGWHVDFGFRWKREMLIKIWVFWMWRYSRLLEMLSWGKFWVNDDAENCLILWYMHTGLVYCLEW
jgi:hypothetical protein